MPSETAIGPYHIVRELGRGGMGVVYEARHPELSRSVALKQAFANRVSKRGLERFTREAHLLARVQHPNIVVIHDLGESPRGPYLVTDLVEGRTLGELKEPPEPRRAAEIVRDLAGALETLHQAGIIHRDLKPDNVIVRPDGVPVLLDFGLARETTQSDAERLTKTGAIVGTPSYMAPEQAGTRGEIDARADVYGLGGILYWLLAGRHPFQAAGYHALLGQLMTEEPPLPSSERDGVPRDLELVCRWAMVKDRNQRCPSAAALREDLERFLGGSAVAARRALVRSPSMVWLLVPVLLLAVAGIVVWATRDREPDSSSEEAVAHEEPEPVASKTLRAEPPQKTRGRRVLSPYVVREHGDTWADFLGERFVVSSTKSYPEVRLWYAGSGKPLRPWSHTFQGVWGQAVHGESSRVAVGGPLRGTSAYACQVLEIRDDTLAPVGARIELKDRSAPGADAACPLAFSPSGRFLAIGTHQARIHVVDLAGRTRTALVHPGENPITGLAFTPDGRRLVSVNGSNIRNLKGAYSLCLWDTSGLEAKGPTGLASTPTLVLKLPGYPKCLAVRAPGMVAVGTYNKRIHLVDLHTGTRQVLRGAGEAAQADAWAREPLALNVPVRGVAFTNALPVRLVSVGGLSTREGSRSEMRWWDVRSRRQQGPTRALKHYGWDVDLAADGTLLLGMSGGRVELWPPSSE